MKKLWFCVLLAACGVSVSPIPDVPDVEDVEESTPSDPGAWARYTIKPGKHWGTLTLGDAGNPMSDLVQGVSTRDYEFAFDASAAYTLVDMVQPDDQLDWNKLPGLSDCNEFDLSQDGVMFAWRWRLDTTPNVLEVTAYANNAGKHLWMDDPPLLTLDRDDLESDTPLRYRLFLEESVYRFVVSGTVRGRKIDVETTLPRRCADLPPDELELQWAAGLYFGGTSLAPQQITGRVFERFKD